MATTRVDFGEWLPDQPGIAGGLQLAKNVYPKAAGYGPIQEEAVYSNSATENLNQIFAGKDNDSNTLLFAAGTTKIFKFDVSTRDLQDVSGTTYSANGSRWDYANFGNVLIAANGANTLQVYDLTTNVTTATFTDLAVDAPKARYVTVVRDFVVTANQPEVSPRRVQWSGINDETVWGQSQVNQSDFQELPDGGIIQGITGGEFGLIFMDRSVYRMSYIGTPLIFQFDNISRTMGCLEPESIVQWHGTTYFLSDDGFYACDGQNIIPIGAEKVNRFFFNSAQQAELPKMSSAVDPVKNLIMWGYKSTDGTYRVLVYHVITKRWSYFESAVDRIISTFTPGIDLEALDVFCNSNIDALGISLDSRVWLGGRLLIAAVQGDKISTFDGGLKPAVLTTGDIETGPNKSMITLVRPIVDGGSGGAAIASRNILNQNINFPATAAANGENRVGVRSFGQYHRVKVEPSGGDWQTAFGAYIDIQQAGMR